ncbi:hypothetical protein H4R20_000150 [Coemansia guatemalensis]|uniref:Uncharacterized protein n=1 Tax=Coemansia guatemalensis TaxID=2761395 RepID=A0A9W8LWX8_9FUNG|nr:hypothetical protein H4R20_000150 [Coemansia guatemalensis]
MDGDDTEPGSTPEEHYTEDAVSAEEVVNHQTKIPDVQYDDLEAWMEYDANAIKFEHEDDYLGHWPALTTHHVQLSNGGDEAVTDRWLQMSEFNWYTELLEPQLTRAMGITELHKLEVTAPSTNQVGPVGGECHTLISELGKVEQRALSKVCFVPTRP